MWLPGVMTTGFYTFGNRSQRRRADRTNRSSLSISSTNGYESPKMRRAVRSTSWTLGASLTRSDGATLDDLREAVTTLEDAERTTRRVFGGTHPSTTGIKAALQHTRAALRARETLSPPG